MTESTASQIQSLVDEATVAHNDYRSDSVAPLLEQVINWPYLNHEVRLWALSLIAIHSQFDSVSSRMPLENIHQKYVACLRADPRFQQIPIWPGRNESMKEPVRVGYFWDFLGSGVDFCFPFLHDRDLYQVVGVTPVGSHYQLRNLGFDKLIEYDPKDLSSAVNQIRAAEIDLLVDLNGRGANPVSDMIIEARVAGRQTMYGNFFSSTHSTSVDSLIGDRAVLDALNPATTHEALVAIEEPIMAVRKASWNHSGSMLAVPSRPRRYRIGTTGKSYKLSDTFLDLLARFLVKNPECSFFYHSCASARYMKDLETRLISRGVDVEQLELFVVGQIEYVDGVRAMDAAIDAFPCNGHLSTVEYLSYGTPIWTLRGDRLTQRYGAMILGHIGLDENVFTDGTCLIDDLARRLVIKTPSSAAALAARVETSRIADPLRATRLFEMAIENCLIAC